jgi:hypothetical protein
MIFQTWVPSISSSNKTDHTSLSYISNKFNRSSFLFHDLSSSDDCMEKQKFQINHCLLFIITSLLLIVHCPYVLFSLMDIYISQLPIFIYLHWFGAIFIPIINLQKN